MCGIVGYVGTRDAVPVIIEGLRRLEYRGYDSAGVAVVNDGGLHRRRSVGKLCNLEESLKAEPLAGAFGLGHTRWATHGRPSEENAHPHQDCSGKIVLVHNGIIENYLPLKTRLAAAGHRFVTETDTEVVAHLVESHYQGSLEAAVRTTLAELEGIYALVVMHKDEPQTLVAARMGPPLVVGIGKGEHFLASESRRCCPHPRLHLPGRRRGHVTLTPCASRTPRGGRDAPQDHPGRGKAEKGGHATSCSRRSTSSRRPRETPLGRIGLEEGIVHPRSWARPRSCAERGGSPTCGTSWHAALVGSTREQVQGPRGGDYAASSGTHAHRT
jgi:glucosamine--fructose-6-phosphate aminotransferase (isomerizing)